MIGGWAAAGFVAAGSRSAGPAEFGGLGPRVSAARSARPIRSARPTLPGRPRFRDGERRASERAKSWLGGRRPIPRRPAPEAPVPPKTRHFRRRRPAGRPRRATPQRCCRTGKNQHPGLGPRGEPTERSGCRFPECRLRPTSGGIGQGRRPRDGSRRRCRAPGSAESAPERPRPVPVIRRRSRNRSPRRGGRETRPPRRSGRIRWAFPTPARPPGHPENGRFVARIRRLRRRGPRGKGARRPRAGARFGYRSGAAFGRRGQWAIQKRIP